MPLTSSYRHPDRWRKVVQCLKAADFKQKVLHTCDAHNDPLADEVHIRVSGALTDLHAADAQYPNDCCKCFMNPKNVQAAKKNY